MTTREYPGLRVTLGPPVLVARAAAGERRWGYHQFPALSRLPDGRLLVTYNDRPDRDDAYGTPGPAMVSADEGASWAPWTPPEPLLAVSHGVISPVGEGEYLAAPITPGLPQAAAEPLPALAGTMAIYGELRLYRLADCAPAVKAFMAQLPATRWSPRTGTWQRETLAWDTHDALVRLRASDPVLPRPYLDTPWVRQGPYLYYADFHQQYLLPDGQVPRTYASWCWRSGDGGRSWQRHGLIAYDARGQRMMGEPAIFPTREGHLACAIRTSHHAPGPLLLTHSQDGGATWEAPKELAPFGVMPQGLLLANGVIVLSYGRPGVSLSFSPSGTARDWVGPWPLLGGESRGPAGESCGYTRLLALGPERALLVYSDFAWPAADGVPGKAILVRQVICQPA